MPESQGLILRPVEDANSARIESLLAANQRLREDVQELTEDRDAARREAKTLRYATDELRRQLGPLHNALKAVFGELDTVPSSENGASYSSAVPDKKTEEWKLWIQKFGPDTLNARMISALLDHHQMTAEQLRVVMRCATNSVYNTITRLNKLGLLAKTGDKYSLKEL